MVTPMVLMTCDIGSSRSVTPYLVSALVDHQAIIPSIVTTVSEGRRSESRCAAVDQVATSR
jgi:hypothetical protein